MVSKIEEAVEYLKKIEAKLDELYDLTNRYRREIIEFAIRESEKLKTKILEEARARGDRLLLEEISKAEEAAKEIMAKGRLEADNIRKRAEGLREEIENLVLRALLQGKITL